MTFSPEDSHHSWPHLHRPRTDLNVSLTPSPAPHQHPEQAGVCVHCLLSMFLLICSGLQVLNKLRTSRAAQLRTLPCSGIECRRNLVLSIVFAFSPLPWRTPGPFCLRALARAAHPLVPTTPSVLSCVPWAWRTYSYESRDWDSCLGAESQGLARVGFPSSEGKG